MIQVLIVVAMCAIAIGAVELFGLPGLAVALILFGAVISLLGWVKHKFFDPMAVYDAERKAVTDHHPASK